MVMDTKKRLIVLTVSFAIVAFGAFSWAAEGGVKIPLMATKMHPGANGTAVISDQSISIQANGLKPNAVYTGWFVNMKPKKQTGAGTSPYMFKTDSSGNGTYSAPLKESPFGKWQVLMIMLHPTGDPTDMKKMVGAFSASLGKKIPLMSMKKHPGASGTTVISDKTISIQANGLKSNAVYTAWFVNMKPKKHETGAGTPPYMFKTDSYGAGTYSAPLNESPFEKWQMLMIVLHPNGDPKDMKNMVGALSVKLK